MSERTKSRTAQASPNWEIWFVVGSVSLLSGLAVADRFFAWLIGEFPTSALLWYIRFEYLRPIAVYHDMAELNFGRWSPWTFSMLAIAAGALIASGVLSRVRLARAVCHHLLFGAAAILVVLCFDSGHSLQPRAIVGAPSEPYLLLGALLASISAALCLRVHAEYIGWNPGSARIVRRVRIALIRVGALVDSTAVEIIEQLNPALRQPRIALARQWPNRRRESRAQ